MNLNELRELYQHREHYNLLVKALTKHYDEISEHDLLTLISETKEKICLDQVPIATQNDNKSFNISFQIFYHGLIDLNKNSYAYSYISIENVLNNILMNEYIQDSMKEAFLVLIQQYDSAIIGRKHQSFFNAISIQRQLHLFDTFFQDKQNKNNIKRLIFSIVKSNSDEKPDYILNYFCQHFKPFVVFKYMVQLFDKTPEEEHSIKNIYNCIDFLVAKFPQFKDNYFYYIKNKPKLIEYTNNTFVEIENTSLTDVFNINENIKPNKKRL